MNIAPLDWAVLVAYLVIITAIGLVVGYRVRQSGEYFLGGRRFGPWLMIGQSFGVGTHAEMPVALAGAVYSVGASAIWFQWKNLFITPFYWLMAPVFRRIRRTTMAELTEDRYGSWMGAIYIVFAVCFFIINTGSMLKGAGKVISQATGGGVGVNEIVVAMTVLFMLYSFVGGLVAAAWTDLFQGFLIIVLSFMLIPLGWSAVGGLDGMKASLEPFRFSLATPVRHHAVGDRDADDQRPGRHHGAAAAARDRRHGQGRADVPDRDVLRQFRQACLHRRLGAGRAHRRRDDRSGARAGRDARRSGERVRVRLPSAALSGRARPDDRVHSGGQHVHVLGVPRGQRGAVHRRPVPAAPGAGPSGPALPVGRAHQRLRDHDARRADAMFLIQSVLYTFLLTETMATFVGISVLGGIIWRRANRWGALASLLSALTTNFLLYYLTGRRLDAWDANVFLAALLVGTASPRRREPAHAARAHAADRVVLRAAADVE